MLPLTSIASTHMLNDSWQVTKQLTEILALPFSFIDLKPEVLFQLSE